MFNAFYVSQSIKPKPRTSHKLLAIAIFFVFWYLHRPLPCKPLKGWFLGSPVFSYLVSFPPASCNTRPCYVYLF